MSYTGQSRCSLKIRHPDHQVHFYKFSQFVHTTLPVNAGDRVKFVGASSAGLGGGLALISHATTFGQITATM